MQEMPSEAESSRGAEPPSTLYILLARLTDEGQKTLHADPELLNDVCRELRIPGTELLARYAVLGQYDFMLMVEARDHQSVARLSMELGARAGLHIETLPAIPVGLLAEQEWEKAIPGLSFEAEPPRR